MYLLWGRRPIGRVDCIENLRRFSKMKPFSYLKTCQILTTPLLRLYKLCKVLYSLTWTLCYINMSSYALHKFLQLLKPSINTPSIHVNNSNPASHLTLRKHEGQISFIHLESITSTFPFISMHRITQCISSEILICSRIRFYLKPCWASFDHEPLKKSGFLPWLETYLTHNKSTAFIRYCIKLRNWSLWKTEQL
jgi:hypothetical protein